MKSIKSVTVRVIGGLGNQLNCYAFGRAIADQNNVALKLDTESGYWNDPYKRKYLLDQFPSLNASLLPFLSKTKFARLLFKCGLKLRAAYSRFLPIPLKSVIVEKRPLCYQAEIHHASYVSNPYFMGYWASYRYYHDIEKELRQELKPPIPTHTLALELLKRIQSVNSCFIHWRSYNEEKGAKRISLGKYYKDAMAFVSGKYPDVKFFVFSDDPDGVRKEVVPPVSKPTYVDLTSAKINSQSLADFYLMYMCDHAIIGDSTFSWWAAWLREHKDRIVVAPRGLSPWGEDWLPRQWFALDINNNNS